MTANELAQRWKESAKEDFETAQILFTNKKYSHCLFFCHLTIEKHLKARIIESTDDAPPATHNLLHLAKLALLSPNQETIEDLSEIITFNVEARYDVHKFRLYKKATEEYTESYLKRLKHL